MNDLQQTYIDNSEASQRADFNKSDFDKLVMEKGRVVILEKAIQCPCKGAYIGARSTCRNCGSTGWIFVNPKETRMILSGIDVSTKYAPWSEEARGKVGVTAMVEEELSYMDKITPIDARSVFGEAITLIKKQGTSNQFIGYCAYEVKDVIYIGKFVDDDTALQKISSFSVEKNRITVTLASEESEISITLRYKHAPVFHIFEFRRETIQSFKLDASKEIQQDLPISAFASRAHYIMNPTNFANNYLLTNTIE